MTSASAFGFAAHSYDAVLLLAAAIKQANTTDGAKVRQALENLQGTLRGRHENLRQAILSDRPRSARSKDYKWTHWKDGKLVGYSDDVIKSLKEADIKM